MALGTMKYSEVSAPADVEILYNSEYVGKALTLDSTAFTSGVCKAGTPMAADGKKAATTSDASTAVGVLLWDVYEDRPQGTIVIGGYINTAKAQAHSGVTVDAAAKAAMKNVVFM
jgi:hypothetical protein